MNRILNLIAMAVVLAILFLLVLGATGSYRTALFAFTLGVCAALLGHGKGEAR